METLILNAAYVALLGSSFTRTVTWLRLLLVAAAAAFIVYGTVENIRSMVVWNIIIGSMHMFRVIQDKRRQDSVVLTPDECALRDEHFPGVSDFDFNLIWKLGEFVEYAQGQIIIAKGSRPDHVGMLLSGNVSIPDIADLGRGDALGEMSFVSGEVAHVDVVAQGWVEMHRWEQRELRSLEQIHPPSARAFEQMLNKALVAKLKP